MRLIRKLTFAIAAAIVSVMGLHAWLQVRQEVTLFDGDLEKSVVMARALRHGVEAVWRLRGLHKATVLVQKVDEGAPEVGISLVPLADARTELGTSADPKLAARLVAGEVVRFVRDGPDGLHRFTYLPLAGDLAPATTLRLVESLARQRAYINTTHAQLVLTTLAIVLGCGAAVALTGTWMVGRPLARLEEKARAIGAGDFTTPLDVRQHDELGDLATTINTMCAQLVDARQRLAQETDARIAAIEKLRHTDRLTSIGQLVAGVAHELGTPLAVIAGRADGLADGEVQGDDVRRSARLISEQTQVMAARIRQLLDFTRRRQPEHGAVNLAALAERTVDMLAPLARRGRITLSLEAPPEPFWIWGDGSELQQALANLVINALQAVAAGGRVTLAVGASHATPPPDRDATADEFVTACVFDDGPGIPPEVLPRLFEPFFTTKPAGQGTGLGLPVAQGIIQEHGGWIAVESDATHGTRFTIFLPRLRDADVEARLPA